MLDTLGIRKTNLRNNELANCARNHNERAAHALAEVPTKVVVADAGTRAARSGMSREKSHLSNFAIPRCTGGSSGMYTRDTAVVAVMRVVV